LGEGAPLSAASLQRLKAQWQLEYDTWKQRRLDARAVGSVWAERLAGQAGLKDRQAARLVLIGARTDGCTGGSRGPAASAHPRHPGGAGRRERRARGLTPWRGMIADGHFGLGAALAEPPPTAAAPRGWHHRILTGLDALPTTPQADAQTW
jgi:hypothetical protein